MAPSGHPPPPPPPATGKVPAAPPKSFPWRPAVVPWNDYEPPVTPIAPPPTMPSPYRSRSGARERDEHPITPTAPTAVQPSSRSRSEYRDRNDNDNVASSVRGIIQQTVVNSHTRSRSPHGQGTERSTPPELRTPSTPASLAPTILYPPGSGASPAPTIFYPPGTPGSIASTIHYPSPEPPVGQGSKRHQENSPEVQNLH